MNGEKMKYRNRGATFILKGGGQWPTLVTLEETEIQKLVELIPNKGGESLKNRTKKVISDLLIQGRIEEIKEKGRGGEK